MDQENTGWQIVVMENNMLINQRNKLGLTQEEVAAKAGIKLEQYAKFESGNRNLSSSSLRIVHAVLTALELDTTAFDKGDYVLEPLPDDHPIRSTLEKI